MSAQPPTVVRRAMVGHAPVPGVGLVGDFPGCILSHRAQGDCCETLGVGVSVLNIIVGLGLSVCLSVCRLSVSVCVCVCLGSWVF